MLSLEKNQPSVTHWYISSSVMFLTSSLLGMTSSVAWGLDYVQRVAWKVCPCRPPNRSFWALHVNVWALSCLGSGWQIGEVVQLTQQVSALAGGVIGASSLGSVCFSL